jgi:predicted methyltransferase
MFGSVDTAPFSARTVTIDPPGDGMADMALVMRNVHTFMAGNFAPQAFKALFRVLKPGGVLGIEEHRAKSTGLQDPQAGTGYVQEEYIKLIAEDAGFKFAGSSEINANPKDTKDHPFGVWTLPPVLRTAALGDPADPDFNNNKYKAIGESDRMTLKFLKPEDASDVKSEEPVDVKP